MKKSVLILLLFTGLVKAQIVNIPDVNFKAHLLAANSSTQIALDATGNWVTIDTNGDNEIQLTEAQNVLSLSIYEPNILDLTGITSFSNLAHLSISANQMWSLDLNALTSLTSLQIGNMPNLLSLQINGLTNLEYLNLNSLNMLSTLNINNLTNLKNLFCFTTNISTLNFGAFTQITEMYLVFNRITNLNLNGFTNLTKLNCSYNLISNLTLIGANNLTELICSGNQLTSLNGLATTLTKLDCSFNQMSSLDVSPLPNLIDFNCMNNQLTSINVNGLNNLQQLNCNGNKLTSLNISGLSSLMHLSCDYNDELTSVSLANLPNLISFNVNGTLTSNASVIGQLTTLSMTNIPNLEYLDCSNGLLTTLNLSGLTELKNLDCSSNQLTSLNLSNLPNLETLNCSRNYITTLDASGLSSLKTFYCGNGYIIGGQIVPSLVNLNVTGLSNLTYLDCSNVQLAALDLTGLTSLEVLICNGINGVSGLITNLNVNGLTNLKHLNCNHLALTSLDVSNLTNLTDLYCNNNDISSLNLTGLVNLQRLDYSYNQLANLSLLNLPSLKHLNCTYNQLVTLDVLNLTSLETLNCSYNQITSLNLSGLNSLIDLNYSFNQLTLSNISGLSNNLINLSCAGNDLTSLDVSGLTGLQVLDCRQNQLTSLDVSSLISLRHLNISTNQFSSIDLSNLTNLEEFFCDTNLLTDLNISAQNELKTLSCSFNQLTNLDLLNHTSLIYLDYSYNSIPNLDVNYLSNLHFLTCNATQTSTIDVSNLLLLRSFSCNQNQLTSLDLSTNTVLDYLDCSSNPLTTLFAKNGANEQNLLFFNSPTLSYICADESQLESIQTELISQGMNTTVVNSYCTFSPGGNHNTITGLTIYDDNNDGCDITDEVNPFIRLDINDGIEIGSTVTNSNGSYNYYTNAGSYVIAPNIENAGWFNFSPASASFTFVDNNNNISNQNFCITAVGIHSDIEVVVMPTSVARPGFDANYKIVFKNKGNQMQSGTITLTFDDSRSDFISATPSENSLTTNTISWNYSNLMPFENRSILFSLNINTPTETPAVNNGDILSYAVSIDPVIGDEIPTDNSFVFNQFVVGSYDPNDITCLEGDSVATSEIGEYLHYVINFENIGTFYAENVVVSNEIDSTKYDISTLQVMNTSHPSYTRITGNKVEFIFEGINLEAASGNPPVGGHGNVLFKIKSKDDLVSGDSVSKRANIYFDYNFPITTNNAVTTFNSLNNTVVRFDENISIYPNPTNGTIHINSKFNIKSIELYDVQGRLLETIIGNAIKVDISTQMNGIYFMKINTEDGSKVEKVIKE